MPSEPQTHEGTRTQQVEGPKEAHEGNPLTHPHPTILNAYPIILEACAGRFTTDQARGGIAARFRIAAERARDGNFSETPQAILEWVPVNTVAMWLMMAVLLFVVRLGTRRMQTIPGPFQSIWEWTYQTLNGFTTNLIGAHHGPALTPLIGSFFLYILFLNLGGLVPGFVSPTAGLNTTVALALCCFLAVQYLGFRHQGLRYLMHFVGEPWWLFPINIPIHIIGELARPLSLSIRLFGNIFGEDTVISALISLGVIAVGVGGYFIPLPVQFPMLLFGIFGSFVQALVFTILAASYIAGVVQEH